MSIRLAYEATNSIEANLLADVLRQHDIAVRVDGEMLQGGVGEIQTMGIVRVLVDEADYASAREVIKQWENGEFTAS
ncbi:DUF2007 domain-containing protein [Bermanella marisrubri]|uniref:DUF2007 domain-containing protein n=1 Tax=Bermanella marisrubri TaxID=207949 RepID=Q1N578_9GAMM|nr:DUF2007 domain-containing protein [Bermanella marisrubri]EAT13200.1 hypothetical protein RED65_00530 [Oceanobacter sp. RED65] [Bermanella marisrubri]QIZ83970.1 DUF2007 domain-containing protein [Bermanella marisrubri]